MVSINFNKSPEVTMGEYYNNLFNDSSEKEKKVNKGNGEQFQKLLDKNIELLSRK